MYNKLLTPLLIIITFISLILFSIFIMKYIEKSSASYASLLKSVQYDVSNEKWDNASAKLEQINKRWSSDSKIWELFTNHHEIDDIYASLLDSIAYVRERDKTLSEASVSKLNYLYEHISDKEKISFENII